MERDRRQYPRVGVTLAVTVEGGGSLWQGKTVDLCERGVKVTLPAKPAKFPLGTSVQLRLALPHNLPLLSVMAMVWRSEPTSMVLLFLDFRSRALEHLKTFVESRLAQAVLASFPVKPPPALETK